MDLTLPRHWQSLFEALQPLLPALTATGVIMALASMLAIPWLLVRMPPDYFNTPSRPLHYRGPLAWVIWFLRNLLALLLLIAGILMLVLPGQGILTILIAIMISTFPGKYDMERAIMRRPRVLRAANWIRRRYGKPDLNHPRDNHPQDSERP